MLYTNFNGKPLGFDDVVLRIQHCKDNDKSIKVTLTNSITRHTLDTSILDIKINKNNKMFSVISGEHANEEYNGIVFGDDVNIRGGGKTKKRRTRKSRKNKRKTRGRR